MILTHIAVFLAQKLEIFSNRLRSLPDELSGLQNLKELNLSRNLFREPPISALSGVTALIKINLSSQSSSTHAWDETAMFRVPSSLLPILHPGLVRLDMWQEKLSSSLQQPRRKPWDRVSAAHLQQAQAAVGHRRPIPTLLF